MAISESHQTAEVVFAAGDHLFSAGEFREALRQGDVDVLTMEVDVCGVVEGEGEARRLEAGKTRFILAGAEQSGAGSAVCVNGRLHEEAGRMQLIASGIEPAPESVRVR